MPAADVVLAAIAARTSRIHVGSAVTVLSSDDPVRVFQRFSTLNALSSGRAEVVLGRGSSIESFPLFGYDLADYERLFEEKTELFAELMKGGPVTWQGTTRAAPARPGRRAAPRVRAVAGLGRRRRQPASVIRAARYGFSLMLAIIGGPPARFAPFSELFRQALTSSASRRAPVGVHAPGHVAETDEQARDEFWPHCARRLTPLASSRGFDPRPRSPSPTRSAPRRPLRRLARDRRRARSSPTSPCSARAAST